jgi:tetratricopeptide (TPR) repeat protein
LTKGEFFSIMLKSCEQEYKTGQVCSMTKGEEDDDARLVSRFYRIDKRVPKEVSEFLKRYEIDKGIEFLDRLLEKDPKFEDAWVWKGVFNSVADRYEEAMAAYDKALEINPQSQPAKEAKQRVLDELNKRSSNKTA